MKKVLGASLILALSLSMMTGCSTNEIVENVEEVKIEKESETITESVVKENSDEDVEKTEEVVESTDKVQEVRESSTYEDLKHFAEKSKDVLSEYHPDKELFWIDLFNDDLTKNEYLFVSEIQIGDDIYKPKGEEFFSLEEIYEITKDARTKPWDELGIDRFNLIKNGYTTYVYEEATGSITYELDIHRDEPFEMKLNIFDYSDFIENTSNENYDGKFILSYCKLTKEDVDTLYSNPEIKEGTLLYTYNGTTFEVLSIDKIEDGLIEVVRIRN